MTKLASKVVRREIDLRPAILRPVIIEIDGDSKVIRIREKGCREPHTIPILTVFKLAILGKV